MNDAIPLARAIRRAGLRLRQRGFTLIELAIALTVVGLVLGASIIPLRMLDEARQLQDEKRRLEVVRDAVVGYALRHRTRARTVQLMTWPTPLFPWEFRLPAGRPYLPCPDWDGDGFEDRRGFVHGVEKPNPRPTVIEIGESPFRDRGARALFFGLSFPGGIHDVRLPHGECMASRGTVPWRTLGVDPSDGWGNRHTYFVDPVFSNAMFGFDRQTIADVSDPRIPKAAGFGTKRYANFLNNSSFQTNGCPAVICDGGRANEGAGCARSWTRDAACGTFEPDGLILKAGAVARATLSGPPGEKLFLAGSVTDGLPFVLVSHGPNGRFAVNHWATLNDPVIQDRFGRILKSSICNSAGEMRPAPLLDKLVSVEDELAQALAHEGMNGTRGSFASSRCSQVANIRDETLVHFHLSFFAWEPPGVSRRGEFDDLLLWMTREELSLAAPGRIPPLPPMVIAYFP